MLSQEQLQSMILMLRRNPDARRQLLDALGMEQLVELPAQVGRLDATMARLADMVADLAAAQLRAEARLEGVEDRLARLETAVTSLVESQRLLQIEVVKIEQWQIGDEGRRRGEQYERKIELRARRLLGEGNGGSPHRDHVMLHMNDLMAHVPDDVDLAEEADPMLADIVWWRDGSYAVVEVSIRVDRSDVLRALQRSEVLRQAGVEVLPVVIGDEWVSEEAAALARQKRVAWKVGADMSESLLAFRSARVG